MYIVPKEKLRHKIYAMENRFADISHIAHETRPFRQRHPWLDPWRLLSIATIVLGLIILAVAYADTLGTLSLVMLVSMLLFALAVCIAWVASHMRTAITAAEFENALFSGAVNAGHEFSILCNLEGKVVYISPTTRRYISSEETAENFEKILRLLKLEDMDKIPLLSAYQAGLAVSCDTQISDAFGFMQDVTLTLRPISRPAGYYIFTAYKSLVISDASEPKENGTWEPLLRALLESFPFPCYLAGKEGSMLYANSAFHTLLGYEPGSLLVPDFELKDVVIPGSNTQDSLATSWKGPVVFRHREGKPIKVKLHVVSLSESSNHPAVAFGYIPPASAAQRVSYDPGDVEKAVVQIWLSALENAPIAIAFLDGEGVISQSNQAFLSMTHQEKMQGWNLLEAVEVNKREEVKKVMEKLRFSVKTLTAPPIEIHIASNPEASALLYISAMGPESDGFIAHMVDTSEQKKLEQRMVNSQKMQAVGQLAGGIAHDFNNLLTAMIGFCDLLLIRHRPGDPSFADIMQIKQNANRAANLVKQLLAFSRKQTLQPQVLDITEILAELSNLIRRLIGEHLTLKIQHGRNLDSVKADKVQMEQVIINLAVNARDAMAGGGNLLIRTENVVIDKKHPIDPSLIPATEEDTILPGKYVLIQVTDNGSGIERTIMQKIFDPFFSTKETGAGTGLGLATVYGIIKQSGGYIYLTSELGKGTSFNLFFKAAAPEEVRKAISAKKEEDEDEHRNLTGKGMILLVEDEAPVRMFSARALKNKGYQVMEAENGEMALDIMREKGSEIDLIVSDVMMPGMDGPSMIKQVVASHPDIKVIFISGYGEDAFMKTFGEAREFNFLAKPYSLKDLAAKVKKVIEG